MSEVFTDFLGNEIKVGDHVVYATVSGKSPVQKFAEVVKITGELKPVYGWRDGSRVVTGQREVFKVGVKEIKNGRGFTRWDATVYDKEQRAFVPNEKGVRTTYPMADNIVKVEVGA